MAHVTKLVPKLPICSNLRRMVSCPIFCPSNPFLGPQTHPIQSNYLPTCVFEFPTLKIGGMSLLPHIEAKLAKKSEKVGKCTKLAHECPREIFQLSCDWARGWHEDNDGMYEVARLPTPSPPNPVYLVVHCRCAASGHSTVHSLHNAAMCFTVCLRQGLGDNGCRYWSLALNVLVLGCQAIMEHVCAPMLPRGPDNGCRGNTLVGFWGAISLR